jgi:hypothetical protein
MYIRVLPFVLLENVDSRQPIISCVIHHSKPRPLKTTSITRPQPSTRPQPPTTYGNNIASGFLVNIAKVPHTNGSLQIHLFKDLMYFKEGNVLKIHVSYWVNPQSKQQYVHFKVELRFFCTIHSTCTKGGNAVSSIFFFFGNIITATFYIYILFYSVLYIYYYQIVVWFMRPYFRRHVTLIVNTTSQYKCTPRRTVNSFVTS